MKKIIPGDGHLGSDYVPFKFLVPLTYIVLFHLRHLSCVLKGPDPTMALYWVMDLGVEPLACSAPGPIPLVLQWTAGMRGQPARGLSDNVTDSMPKVLGTSFLYSHSNQKRQLPRQEVRPLRVVK